MSVEKEAYVDGHKDAAAYLKGGVSIERVDKHQQNPIDAAYNAGWNKAINDFHGHASGPGDPSRRELAEGSDGPGADEVKKEEVKKMALTIEELKGELDGFCGTLQYHQHFTGGKFTDGVKHLADRAGAYWLIDAVFSYQVGKEIRDLPFQIWTLKVLRSELGKNENEPMAVLEMVEDTDKPLMVSQKIPYTNFPKGEIKLYFQNGVLFLPSEY